MHKHKITKLWALLLGLCMVVGLLTPGVHIRAEKSELFKIYLGDDGVGTIFIDGEAKTLKQTGEIEVLDKDDATNFIDEPFETDSNGYLYQEDINKHIEKDVDGGNENAFKSFLQGTDYQSKHAYILTGYKNLKDNLLRDLEGQFGNHDLLRLQWKDSTQYELDTASVQLEDFKGNITTIKAYADLHYANINGSNEKIKVDKHPEIKLYTENRDGYPRLGSEKTDLSGFIKTVAGDLESTLKLPDDNPVKILASAKFRIIDLPSGVNGKIADNLIFRINLENAFKADSMLKDWLERLTAEGKDISAEKDSFGVALFYNNKIHTGSSLEGVQRSGSDLRFAKRLFGINGSTDVIALIYVKVQQEKFLMPDFSFENKAPFLLKELWRTKEAVSYNFEVANNPQNAQVLIDEIENRAKNSKPNADGTVLKKPSTDAEIYTGLSKEGRVVWFAAKDNKPFDRNNFKNTLFLQSRAEDFGDVESELGKSLPIEYYGMWAMTLRVHANSGKFNETNREQYPDAVLPWYEQPNNTNYNHKFNGEERHFAVPYGGTFGGLQGFKSLIQPTKEKQYFDGWVIEEDGKYYRVSDSHVVDVSEQNKKNEVEINGNKVTIEGWKYSNEIKFDRNYDLYATWTEKYPLHFYTYLVKGNNELELFKYADKEGYFIKSLLIEKDGIDRYFVQFDQDYVVKALKDYYGAQVFDGTDNAIVNFDTKNLGNGDKPYVHFGNIDHDLTSGEMKLYINPSVSGERVNLYLKRTSGTQSKVTLGFSSNHPYYSRSDNDMTIKLVDNNGYAEGQLTQDLIDKLNEKADASDDVDDIHKKMGFTEFLRYVKEYSAKGAIADKVNFPEADAFNAYARKHPGKINNKGGKFIGWYDKPYDQIKDLPKKDTGFGDSQPMHMLVDANGKLTSEGLKRKFSGNVILYAGFERPYKVQLNLMYNPSDPKSKGPDGAITVSEYYFPEGTVYQEFTKRYEKIHRDGYIFKGWYRDSETKGEAVDLMNLGQLTEDITLYAKWIEKIDITFHANYTSETRVKQFAEGDPLEYPLFKRPGYVVDKWLTDKNDETKVASNFANKGEENLYAHWVKGTPVEVHWKWTNFEGAEETHVDPYQVAGEVLEEHRPYTESELNAAGYVRIDWYEANESGDKLKQVPEVFDANNPQLPSDKAKKYYVGELVQKLSVTIKDTKSIPYKPDFFNATVELKRKAQRNIDLLPNGFEIIIDFTPKSNLTEPNGLLNQAFDADTNKEDETIPYDRYQPGNFQVIYQVNGQPLSAQEIENLGIEGLQVRGLPFDKVIPGEQGKDYSLKGERYMYELVGKTRIEDLSIDGSMGFYAPHKSADDIYGFVIGKKEVSQIVVKFYEGIEAGKPVKLIKELQIRANSDKTKIPADVLNSKNSEPGFENHTIQDFYELKSGDIYDKDKPLNFTSDAELIANWVKGGEVTVYYLDEKNRSRAISLIAKKEYTPEQLLNDLEKQVGTLTPEQEEMVLDKDAGIFTLQRGKSDAFKKVFAGGKNYVPEAGDKLKVLWRVPRVIFNANGSKFVKNASPTFYVPIEKGLIKAVPTAEELYPYVENGIEHFFTGWVSDDDNDPNAVTIDFATRVFTDGDTIYARWRAKKKLLIYFRLRGGRNPLGPGEDLREAITVFVEPGKPMSMQLIDELLKDKMGEDDRRTIKYVDIERQVTKVFNNIEDQTTYNGENLANLKGTGDAPDSNEIQDDGLEDEVVLYYEYISNPVTITFNKNCTNEDVLEPKPRIVESGDLIREPKIPKEFNPEARTGYDFKGWFRNQEDAETFQNPVQFPFYATESETLIAGWSGHPVYIIYRYNNGMGNETRLAKIGDKLPAPTFPEPVWPGMVLDGWYITIGKGVGVNVKKGDGSNGTAKSAQEAAEAVQAQFGSEIQGPMLIDAVWKFDPNNPAIKSLKEGTPGTQAGIQASSTPQDSVLNSEVAETGESDYKPMVMLLLAGAALLMIAKKFRR